MGWRSERIQIEIYFNNPARGQIGQECFLLMNMLLIEDSQKGIRLQDQFTLGEF